MFTNSFKWTLQINICGVSLDKFSNTCLTNSKVQISVNIFCKISSIFFTCVNLHTSNLEIMVSRGALDERHCHYERKINHMASYHVIDNLHSVCVDYLYYFFCSDFSYHDSK